MTDVIIIGGGPAGVSAALTAMHRGKTALIVSSPPEDSPLWKAEHIDNYPGLPGVTGRELLQKLLLHAEGSGAKIMRGRVLSVLPMGGAFGVSVGSNFVQGRAVVIASGLSRAKPYPGEAEFLGAGVSYCAEFLRSIGCEVEYFDAARAKKYEIRGSQRVEALIADGTEYAVECVFILRAGVVPGSLVPGLELEGPHIKVNADMATSVPGVFAAGDCVGAPYQVGKAVGEGNIAGISAAKYVENTHEEE